MAIAELFCANSRHIKEHAWWCITRSEQSDDGERLHAHADAFGGHLNLTIWDDGALLFNMMKGYREGHWIGNYDFMVMRRSWRPSAC